MRVRLVRKSPRLPRGLGAASLLGLLLPLVLRIVGPSFGMQKPMWWATFVSASWLVSLVAGLGSLALTARRSAADADVEPCPGGFTITTAEGAQRVVEAELSTVNVRAKGPRGEIQLRLRDGAELFLETPDPAAAHALVDRAGLGRGSRIATEIGAAHHGIALGLAALASFLFAVDIAGRIGGQGAPSVATAIAWLVGSAAAFGLAASIARAPRVELGPDGLTVHARRGTRRVAHRALAQVEEADEGLWLVQTDGRRVLVPIAREHALRASVTTRLRRAIGERDDDAAALLLRRGRALDEWRTALAALATDEYRGVSREDAARVLEAPGTTNEQRVGAALALASVPDGPARIRIAAEACVDPQLRVALEQAAEGSLTEEALAFLERGVT